MPSSAPQAIAEVSRRHNARRKMQSCIERYATRTSKTRKQSLTNSSSHRIRIQCGRPPAATSLAPLGNSTQSGVPFE